MFNFLSKINPFYKFVFIIVSSTILTFLHFLWLNVAVFGICLLLLFLGAPSKQFLKALKFLIPVSILAFSLFMSGIHFGVDASSELGSVSFESTQNGLNMSTRVFAFASLGLLFALTTDSHALIKSMQKEAKLPRKFAYGMLCAVNLLPYMKQEYQHARLAFLVRGERIHFFSLKPIFSMLVHCFQWSETLSIAMFSKGFYEDGSI
ncbi:MAG: energy-coupling factor transporter transmembrane protein EcfT [Lachnospiraceae bacterium]|nr:energy-coupling factor transporter transmembrane protein EcfT [Lachnospiraceae bacterium]